jgi:tetratricopeptide (TPR) repeat protein
MQREPRGRQTISAIVLCLVLLMPSTIVRSQPNDEVIRSVNLADRYLLAGSYAKAVNAYNQAIAAGLLNADLYRNLSLALYELRLVDDALKAMEQAVGLNPTSDIFLKELGILYVVKGRDKEGEKALLTALSRNPGLTEAYYFLGELFYKEQQYQFSWFAAKTAEKLGFDASILLQKLAAVSTAPDVYPWQHPGEKLAFRKLQFASEEKATAFLNRIAKGDLFEYATNVLLGGYAGEFEANELLPQLAVEFQAREPFSAPLLFAQEDGYLVIQRLMPFDLEQWQSLLTPAQSHALSPPFFPKRKKYQDRIDDYGSLLRGTIDYDKVKVYAGAFHDENLARQRVMNLRALHLPAFYLISGGSGNQPLYNVVAGQYETREQAQGIRKKLQEKGYASFLSGRLE